MTDPFDLARQRFLAALRARLTDPSVTPAEREETCRETIAAVSQMMVLAECARG